MNVSGFISQQPEPKKGIMTIVRSWVLDPGRYTEEKISCNIPNFSLFGHLCYLNPTDDGVELGFKGYELSDDERILESRGPKW